MKRILTIFSILLFLLAGLIFWWKNKNNLDFNTNHFGDIPLKNNFAIWGFSTPTRWDVVDTSNLQSPPSIEGIINLGLVYSFRHMNSRECYLDSLTRFHIYNNYLIAQSTDTTHFKASYFILDLEAKLEEKISLNRLSDFQTSCKNKGIKDLSMKTPEEWLSIWKRDGRLPWFPEHVGR